MADRPILFSAPMVRALIEGRKTQTRRIITPQPVIEANGTWRWEGRNKGFVGAMGTHIDEGFPASAKAHSRVQPGDRLWVREACAIVGSVDPGYVLYRADGYESECERHGFDKPFPPESEARWRPSIHMPRWASRLTLEMISTRVERLQDISRSDAIAEGLEWVAPTFGISGIASSWSADPVVSYVALWDDIHGPGSWESNPWVFAHTFLTINRNIDQIAEAA